MHELICPSRLPREVAGERRRNERFPSLMPGLDRLDPGIHAFAWCHQDVDGLAFASPKGLGPGRGTGPGHDERD
jgi:hypothetical protein